MKTIDKQLKDLESKYRRYYKRLKVGDSSETLIVQKRGKKSFYYVQTYDPEGKKRSRRYLKKEDYKRIKELAQTTYNIKLKKLVKKRLDQLEKINKDFRFDELDQLYGLLEEDRSI